jgi:hypothetical protein
MTGNFTDRDDGPGALGRLAIHEPDGKRDARVRARCHAVLQKRRRRLLSPARPAWRPTLEPLLVGCACAMFLAEVLSRAAYLYRF